MYCPHCPVLYGQYPQQWDKTELLEHVREQHPEKLAARMPACRNCGMPCETGRAPNPNGGWLCHYCGLYEDQTVCPMCRSLVTRSRLAARA